MGAVAAQDWGGDKGRATRWWEANMSIGRHRSSSLSIRILRLNLLHLRDARFSWSLGGEPAIADRSTDLLTSGSEFFLSKVSLRRSAHHRRVRNRTDELSTSRCHDDRPLVISKVDSKASLNTRAKVQTSRDEEENIYAVVDGAGMVTPTSDHQTHECADSRKLGLVPTR